ncbi:MAG: TRAP transporter TatT component family protein [Oligoflexia bacterium]|nr:TRAP transporter TatT component family protein [Oligoflexia bacterium]
MKTKTLVHKTFAAIIFSVFLMKTITIQALTLDQLKRVDRIAEIHETAVDEVLKTSKWLEDVCLADGKDDECFAQLSRVNFFYAVDHDKKDERIKRYQKAIDAADKSLALNTKNITANFWKAAAIGKQGLDIGISKAFGNAPAMKKHLEIILSIDEKFEQAGAHRAMGRLYYELPGWPFSFGSFPKALEHMKKAVALAPEHYGNRIYYAQAELKHTGNKDLARPQIEAVLNMKDDPQHRIEQTEFRELALELKKKL